jgi:hypothetical protein
MLGWFSPCGLGHSCNLVLPQLVMSAFHGIDLFSHFLQELQTLWPENNVWKFFRLEVPVTWPSPTCPGSFFNASFSRQLTIWPILKVATCRLYSKHLISLRGSQLLQVWVRQDTTAIHRSTWCISSSDDENLIARCINEGRDRDEYSNSYFGYVSIVQYTDNIVALW